MRLCRPWHLAALSSFLVLLVSIPLFSSCSSSSPGPASESPAIQPGQGSPTVVAPGSTGNKSSPKSSVSTAAMNAQTATVRLKTYSLVDQQGTGGEAASILVPSDWRTEGTVNWVLDVPVMPATVNLRTSNPSGSEVFEGFPSLPFFWTDNQLTLAISPVGSRYFGCEVHPLVEPGEALRTIVLPRLRQTVTNLKITQEQDLTLPAPPPQQPGALRTSSKAAKVRFEYQSGGLSMEEETYCSVDALYIPVQGISGTTTSIFWSVANISSFKAEKGKLDASAKLFQTVIHSARVNPDWFNKYNQVVLFLIQNQIQRIESMGRLSQMLSQTSSQISDEMMQAYDERQAVTDKIANDFSQYMRGVDSYYDPIEQKNVELPSGYDNAWTNSLGEYILADNSSYNPNVGSNLNWQPMKRQP
jgi:hypothetical protein